MFAQIDVRGGDATCTVVVVAGEVDLASAGELRSALATAAEGRPEQILVDLSGVTFVDSSGLGAIAGGLRAQRAHGGQLRVIGAPAHVRRVFEISGLGELLGD